LMSMAAQQSWSDLMAELDPRESVEEVLDGQDRMWVLNGDVPEQNTLQIVRMATLGDSVEVFAAPKPGTPLDERGIFLHFQLMPFFVHHVRAKSTLSDWTALQREYAELAQEMDEDEDEDDEEDEADEPLQVSQVPPPPPPPPMNGSTTTNLNPPNQES
jgi:hypothetical protein